MHSIHKTRADDPTYEEEVSNRLEQRLVVTDLKKWHGDILIYELEKKL